MLTIIIAGLLHFTLETADFNFFNQAFIDRGAVTWPDNIDLAPDAMYNAIKANGEWVLR